MGIVIKTQNVKYGYAATPPVPPKYDDSDFKGWDSDEYKCVTRNLNINTVYAIKRFTVTFVFEGYITKVQSDVAYGTSATPPFIQPKEGYDVIWDDYSNITSNTTINGKYVRQSDVHMVRFFKKNPLNPSDISVITTEFVSHGKSANPPTAQEVDESPPSVSQDHYIFIGWSDDYTRIVQDIDLYTKYHKVNQILQLRCYELSYKPEKTYTFDISAIPMPLKLTSGTTGSGKYISPFEELNASKSQRQLFVIEATDLSPDSSLSSIDQYCFASSHTKKVQKVMFPSVITVGIKAFYDCKDLTEISMEKLKYASSHSFSCLKSLTNISLPKLEELGERGIANCHKLTTVSMPSLKIVGKDAFYECDAITELNLSNLTSVSQNSFYGMDSLVSFSAPNITTIDSKYILTSTSLETINISSVTKICENAFGSSVYTRVTELYLPNIISIGSNGLRIFGKTITKLTLNLNKKSSLENEMSQLKMWGMGTYKNGTAKNLNGKVITIEWK